MKVRFLYALVLCSLAFSTLQAALPVAETTFTLKGVLSHQNYGPFVFRHQAKIKLESGVFQINILADGKAFTLVDTDSGLAYGVYELVLGRMIDIGDVLFTITRVDAPPPVTFLPPAAPSLFDDTSFAIEYTLLNQVAYNWEMNGAAGGNQNIERKGAALKARKGLFIMQIGLITAADWDHTIVEGGDTFSNAELADGSGWFASAGLSIPVFKEGRWSAVINGETLYRSEELSLQYGAWEIESITSTTDTNAITNVVSTITNLRFVNHDEKATLTETLVTVGVQLSYNAPSWFMYAGLKALPWSDTTLDAVITADDRKYRLTFDRKDPITASGGLGFNIRGTKAYVEIEGGGEMAVRIGLSQDL